MARGLRFTISAFDKTRRAFKSVEDRATRLQKQFKGISRSIGGIGSGLVAAFAGAGISAIVRATDNIAKFSQRLSISTNALSELKFAGEQTGVEFNSLALGLQRMTRRISEAAMGAGEAQGALRELGLNAAQLNNLPVEEKFNQIADALNGVESQSDKVRLAFKLFDSEGVALIQTMEGGSQAVNRLREELRQLGGVVDEQAGRKMAALNDAWNRFTVSIEGAARNLLVLFAPVLEGILKLFTALISGINKVLKGFRTLAIVANTGLNNIRRGLGLLSDEEFDQRLQRNTNSVRSLWSQTNQAAEAMRSLDANALRANKTLERLSGASSTPRSTSLERDGSTDRIIDDFDRIQSKSEEVSESIRDAFKDSLKGVGDDVNSLGDIFSNVMNRIRSEAINRSADRLGDALFSQAQGLFNGVAQEAFRQGNSVGPVQPSLSGFSDFFGGFFANGGNFSGGKPIMVGERGPELIMPRQSGTVIPNEAISRQGMNIVINVSTPDANSFRQSQGQIAAEMNMAMQRAAGRNL